MATKATMGHSEEKPRQMGFMTTRVLYTEREPLFAAEAGMTIGQAVDAQLARMSEQPFNPPEGWVAPVIHSVTVELPTD